MEQAVHTRERGRPCAGSTGSRCAAAASGADVHRNHYWASAKCITALLSRKVSHRDHSDELAIGTVHCARIHIKSVSALAVMD